MYHVSGFDNSRRVTVRVRFEVVILKVREVFTALKTLVNTVKTDFLQWGMVGWVPSTNPPVVIYCFT